jgi:hypothetical protein
MKNEEMGLFYKYRIRNTYKILVGKPEWKRQLGRPRRSGIVRKQSTRAWTGLMWLRAGASDGLL